MSFNRRGGDRRPDRPPRREGGSDRPYGGGGDRGFGGRDRPPRPEGGDRPYGDRGYGRGGGGDRSYGQRPRFDRPADEGGMSIRLDPRRLGALKHLAGEAGVRPGDLVRRWVEERIDAERVGPDGRSLEQRVTALEERLAALDGGAGERQEAAGSAAVAAEPDRPEPARPAAEAEAPDEPTVAASEATVPETEPSQPAPRARRTRASAAPSERVALHDEMIAVIRERGPMTAAELAEAITERGRYAPPRSGKQLDAAMVSQRVSNPTYRARFTRNEGRIGLAE